MFMASDHTEAINASRLGISSGWPSASIALPNPQSEKTSLAGINQRAGMVTLCRRAEHCSGAARRREPAG